MWTNKGSGRITQLGFAWNKVYYNICTVCSPGISTELGTNSHRRVHYQPHVGYYNIYHMGGARGVMVIIVGNGHGDTSSNPGRD